MSDTTPIAGVAGRYAAALFELADEAGALETVEGQLRAIRSALDASADLRALIASPLYTREQQGSAMAAVLARMAIGAPTANLIGLMAEKRRLMVLPGVIDAFAGLLAARRGVVAAEVRAAAPLSDAQIADLRRALDAATGKRVALDIRIDPALIGGLVVKVGSRMIDSSIRARLARLEAVMKEASI